MTAKRVLADERGATAIEYALLAGFVATVVIGAVASLGRSLEAFYGGTNERLVTEIEASAEE